MKARVKATGEIVSVRVYNKGFDYNGRQFINYEDTKNHKTYSDNQLDFDNTDNSPDDYWTRLEHQAAIAAMQGTLANADLLYSLCKDRGNCPVKVVAIEFANACAHALVEKYKKEEK